MEHEILISEKIRLEELKPIPWEKERIWNGIQRDRKTTGHSAYFIAASVALACFTFYYIQADLDQNRPIRDAMRESNIDPCNPEIQESSTAESIQSIEDCDDGIMPPRQIAKWNETIQGSVPLITITPMRDSISLVKTEILTLDSVHVSSLTVDERLTEDPPRVEAIIGVIPVEQKNIRIAKEKKLRFKFSRDHYEFFSDDDPKKPVLTARIN